MKTIPLTQGQVALVDDCDFEWLSKYRWHANRPGKDRPFYAYTRVGPERKKITMHRLIMNTPSGMMTDHKNLNGLDNRRDNLRICTQVQNLANVGKRSNNRSGFKGVYQLSNGRWASLLRVNKKRKWLGSFESAGEAHEAYKSAALANEQIAAFVRFQ